MTAPRKILYVEAGTTGGGSAESLYQHLKVLDRAKFQPYVIFLNRNLSYDRILGLDVQCAVLFDWFYDNDFRKINHRFTKWISRCQYAFEIYLPTIALKTERAIHYGAIQRLQRFIVDNQIQLVHSNNQAHRDYFTFVATRNLRIPCIAHLRSVNSNGFSPNKAQYVNQHVQTLLANCHSVAEHWIQLGISSDKVRVIYNAIENLDCKPFPIHQRFGIPQATRIVGIVGLIIPVRNHLFLIEAFNKLQCRCPNTHLLIVGGGQEFDYIAQIKNRIHELGLSRKVSLIGHYPNAKEIISNLDVLVLPYTIEPFGRTLLEAWQLNTPVVLSRVDYIESIVQDRTNALLFDLHSQDQLANALESALFDDRLRTRLTTNGRRHCKDNFSIEEYNEKISTVYDTIFGNNESI